MMMQFGKWRDWDREKIKITLSVKLAGRKIKQDAMTSYFWENSDNKDMDEFRIVPEVQMKI